MNLPIMMTASVSTRGMKGAAFTDAQREQMYLDTMLFYFRVLPDDQKIVFAENSGWDLASFATKVRKGMEAQPALRSVLQTFYSRVEFVAVDPAICDQTRGKGYNEILMMNDTVAQSAFIREAGAFMKVTGRYPIYNLPRLLREAESFIASGGQFYGDMKDHKVFDVLFYFNTAKWNGHAMGTAVFAVTVDFYLRELSESYRECNDYTNQWIEVVWHRLLIPYRHGSKPTSSPTPPLSSRPPHSSSRPSHPSSLIAHPSPVHLRFPVEAEYGGWQGSDVKTLACSQNNDSIKAKFSRFVGNCIRTFTPWFWF